MPRTATMDPPAATMLSRPCTSEMAPLIADTGEGGEDAFADDVRPGGYDGPLDVGHDLLTIEIA